MFCQQAPSQCTYQLGGKSGTCAALCSNCTIEEMCTMAGECVAKSCMKDADCPVDGYAVYSCQSGTCAVKTCTTSAECGTNYCVNKACYTEQGLCVQPGA
jgi:hypothetical protein